MLDLTQHLQSNVAYLLQGHITGGKKSALNLFNFSFFNDSVVSVTPYFRNYVFSRRNAGFSLDSSLVGYRYSSKSSKWRLRFFKIWALNTTTLVSSTAKRCITRRSMFGRGQSSLSLFMSFMSAKHTRPSTSERPLFSAEVGKFGINRLWLGRFSFKPTVFNFSALGVLRGLFFKS